MSNKLIVLLISFSMISGCLGFGEEVETTDYNLDSFSETQRFVNNGFGATEGKLDLLFGISHEVFIGDGAPVLFLEVRSGVITLNCPLSESMLNTNCGLEMDWYYDAPTYTGAERSTDSSGAQDVTAIVYGRQQSESYCSSVTGQRYLPICESDIYFSESYDSPLNVMGDETLYLEITDEDGNVHWETSIYIPTLDYDNDGFDDFADVCWDQYAPNSENGCPDADSDGIVDEEDFYDLGNGGLRVWISEVSTIEGELYDTGQLFPCSGTNYNSQYGGTDNAVPYSWVNDGEEDCSTGNDENYAKEPEDPDLLWDIAVDWNCDGIDDDEYSMTEEGVHFVDVKTVTRTLNSATNDGMVLSKDVPDSITKLCFGVFVYDRDKAEDSEIMLDSSSNTEWLSSTWTIPSSDFSSGDYILTASGTNEDGDDDIDVSYKVTISPYNVES